MSAEDMLDNLLGKPTRIKPSASLFVFDLDGTLADDRHRAHHVETKPRDYDTYQSLCVEDPPVPGVLALARTLQEVGQLGILSGRDDTWRTQTYHWLDQFGLEPDWLCLRSKEQYGIRNPIYKLESLRLVMDSVDVRFVIDDHPGVKELVEAELNIPVITVAGVRDHTKGSV